ncbi:MAG: DUF2058 domain-containing protein [Gammaproteobacteria bacterium]|nr:DUF2058 domain-containing protein [Gammaproteobacteria bacterium]
MNNPFQEQLLKAGIVNKQQVQKAQQQKRKNRKQQSSKKTEPTNTIEINAKKLASEKAQRDRELNQKKQEQALKKAISAEIDQLITNNLIERDDNCELIYHFEHQKKVKQIYINDIQKQQIIQGKIGIARIQGRYELVPESIATKIQARNEKRIIIFTITPENTNENDPYANYQVPDDLIW